MKSPLPSPGRWIAAPRKPFNWVPMVLWYVLFCLVLFAIEFEMRLSGGRTQIFTAMLLSRLGSVVGSWFLIYRIIQMRRPGPATVEGGFGYQLPAAVSIFVEGKALGDDHGIVWLSDGLFGFSGHAMSFLISGENLISKDELVRPQGNLPPNAFILRDAPKSAYLCIVPAAGEEEKFQHRMNELVRRRLPVQSDLVWPPLEPYSEVAKA